MASDQWDGLPENPEMDGWHWLQDSRDFPIPARWVAELHGWADSGIHSPQGIIELGFHYLGPCITPADLAAAIQAEREACAAVAKNEQRCRYTDLADMRADKEHNTGAICFTAGGAGSAKSIEAEIRGRGPTDALAARIAEARREGMEAAAVIAEERGDYGAIWPDGQDIADAIRAANNANKEVSTPDQVRAIPGHG